MRVDKGKNSGRRRSSSIQSRLFVYGTLMNDNYVEMLLKRKVESVAGELNNYMCISPSWSFPFIVKHFGHSTHGRVLTGLSEDEMRLLDQFEVEGDLYYRKTVTIKIGDQRRRCQTYIGNIQNLQKSFGENVKFEDRYDLFLERRIDDIIAEMPTDRPDISRRVFRELMGAAVDNIINSHFDGNYICNYIMIQALKDEHAPSLQDVLANDELRPYAGNYMRLACQHIVLNQLVDHIRHQFPNAVRVSQQYYRHGLAILLAFMYYNGRKRGLNRLFAENGLDTIIEGRSYRDYATVAVDIFDEIYRKEEVEAYIDMVEDNWHPSSTPMGAELEFSHLGTKAVYAEPGEDKVYDGFYWFRDFDLFRRLWRLGGHVDSHRKITVSQKRHRGFLEYALGRFQIIGDLSRPLFDCPWAMSRLINEAVRFLDIPPHSLHLSLELPGGHKNITNVRHQDDDLVCLLMLGGDLRHDSDGKLREWRVHANELDTNFMHSLHFSDRKYHFCRPDQDQDEAADIMEYKFMRLFSNETDYESLIVALKGYQLSVHGRPVSIQLDKGYELPEQIFMREWAANPQPLDHLSISGFIGKVERGIIEEKNFSKLERRDNEMLEKIERRLNSANDFVKLGGL